MPFDAKKNLAIATVANSPGAAGVSLVVAAAEGARFPAVPFNGTVWPATELPTPANAEVVRVTARTTDTLTITRAQEGTTARAIVAGDLFAATITAKSLTDIESGVNFPLLTTPGTVTTPNLASAPATALILAPAGTERGRLHASGGFSWGGTTDPGAGSLSVSGDLVVASGTIRQPTNDGADTGRLLLAGGGGVDATRGAHLVLNGNEGPLTGGIQIIAGDASGGNMYFYSGATALRGMIHRSGGFSWGGPLDAGAGIIHIGAGGYAAGEKFINLNPGVITVGTNTVANWAIINFQNNNGQVGYIATNGTTTAYNTTSDARLKTPLNRHTDPSVLRDTVIHNFLWTKDGTKGHGVFAQEAVKVAPFAVSVGSDDRDEHGNLWHPWGVDYAKYVPDLITGWQDHDQRFDAMAARVAFLEGAVTALRTPDSPAAEWFNRLRTWIASWWPSWVTP